MILIVIDLFGGAMLEARFEDTWVQYKQRVNRWPKILDENRCLI